MKQSRRNLLFGFGRVAVATVASTAVPEIVEARDDDGYFEHPAEYLDAMQAIGYHVVAGFQRLRDGTIHPMGVYEYAPSEDWPDHNWTKFHRVSMRVPIQMAADMPQGDWWKSVWKYLYERGFREDVTPKKAGAGVPS